MAEQYASDYINDIKVPSEWTPSKEDYVKILNKFTTFIVKDDCYWGWKSQDKIADVFDDNTFGFVWNSFPNMRASILATVVDNCDRMPMCSKEMRKDVMSQLWDIIPQNDVLPDNKIRMAIAKELHSDFDYMDEIFSLRLIDQDGSILSRWHRQGLSHSADPLFFAYCWNDIKRSKGYIEEKIDVARMMFRNNRAVSVKVVEEAATKGTKKLKRVFVDEISDVLSEVNNKLRWADHDDPLLSYWKRTKSSFENYALMFANFDDPGSLSMLADCLSVENLPWIMPLAGKHYWISNTIQSRIDQSKD